MSEFGALNGSTKSASEITNILNKADSMYKILLYIKSLNNIYNLYKINLNNNIN